MEFCVVYWETIIDKEIQRINGKGKENIFILILFNKSKYLK